MIRQNKGQCLFVETYMVLYNMCQKAHDLQYELMRLFKAQVNKINSKGRRYGNHPNPYKENLTAKFKAKNIAYEEATTKR